MKQRHNRSSCPRTAVTYVRAEVIKYLGVLIDSRLNWPPKLTNSVRNSAQPFVIKRLSHISTESSTTAYFALFELHIRRYRRVVWGYSSQGNLPRVFIIQESNNQNTSWDRFRDSCRGVFRRLFRKVCSEG